MDKIRFSHIPKTAGTTFVDLLSRIYRGPIFGSYGKPKGPERFLSLDASKRSKIVLFTGHEPLITGVKEIDAFPTITFIRDPIERVKSYCQHVSEGKSISLVDEFPPDRFDLGFPPDRFDLGNFLNLENIRLNNLQARFILGHTTYEIHEQNPALLIDKAMDLLTNRVLHFGIVEYFDESLMMFRLKLGWPWPFYFSLNKRDESKAIRFSDDHLATIREHNRIDIQIYKAALQIFEDRMQKNQDYLESSLAEFHRIQRALKPLATLYPFIYKVKRRLVFRF
jgi:hypothetical protein